MKKGEGVVVITIDGERGGGGDGGVTRKESREKQAVKLAMENGGRAAEVVERPTEGMRRGGCSEGDGAEGKGGNRGW